MIEHTVYALSVCKEWSLVSVEIVLHLKVSIAPTIFSPSAAYHSEFGLRVSTASTRYVHEDLAEIVFVLG